MSDSISLAEKDARERGIEPLYVGIVQEISAFSNAEDLVIVVSKYNFDVFQAEPYKVLKYNSLFNLTTLKATAYNIQLTFGKDKFICFSQEINKIVPLIAETVQTILKPSCIKEIDFGPYNIRKIEPTPFSILKRLLAISSLKQIKLTQVFLDRFIHILETSKSYIKISNFEDQEIAQKLLVEVLPLCPFVRGIEISLTPETKDVYEYAAEYVSEPWNLEHISIDGPVDSFFQQFLDNIQQNNDLHLRSICFINSEFKEADIDKIKVSLKPKSIKNISFQNAFKDDKAKKAFSNTFLKHTPWKDIIYLNLNNTVNMSYSSIFKFIQNKLEFLSLEDCNLDITNVFQLLSSSQYKFPNLSSLNLNRNYALRVNRTVQIPLTLSSLSLNSIKWSENTLLTTIENIFSCFSKKGIRLAISDCNCPTNEWSKVFTYFPKTTFNQLYSLVWDNNPVHSQIFDFLSKNRSLFNLSMNYCFSESNPYEIEMLSKFLARADSLLYLSLKGKKNYTFGKYIKNVVDSLAQCSRIKYLDLSDQLANDYFFLYISNLIGIRSLELLVLNGVVPENLQTYKNFLYQVSRNDTFYLSFPFNDLEDLLINDRISVDEVQQIKEDFALESFEGFPEVFNGDENKLNNNNNDNIELNNNEEEEEVYDLIPYFTEIEEPLFPQYITYEIENDQNLIKKSMSSPNGLMRSFPKPKENTLKPPTLSAKRLFELAGKTKQPKRHSSEVKFSPTKQKQPVRVKTNDKQSFDKQQSTPAFQYKMPQEMEESSDEEIPKELPVSPKPLIKSTPQFKVGTHKKPAVKISSPKENSPKSRSKTPEPESPKKDKESSFDQNKGNQKSQQNGKIEKLARSSIVLNTFEGNKIQRRVSIISYTDSENSSTNSTSNENENKESSFTIQSKHKKQSNSKLIEKETKRAVVFDSRHNGIDLDRIPISPKSPTSFKKRNKSVPPHPKTVLDIPNWPSDPLNASDGFDITNDKSAIATLGDPLTIDHQNITMPTIINDIADENQQLPENENDTNTTSVSSNFAFQNDKENQGQNKDNKQKENDAYNQKSAKTSDAQTQNSSERKHKHRHSKSNPQISSDKLDNVVQKENENSEKEKSEPSIEMNTEKKEERRHKHHRTKSSGDKDKNSEQIRSIKEEEIKIEPKESSSNIIQESSAKDDTQNKEEENVKSQKTSNSTKTEKSSINEDTTIHVSILSSKELSDKSHNQSHNSPITEKIQEESNYIPSINEEKSKESSIVIQNPSENEPKETQIENMKETIETNHENKENENIDTEKNEKELNQIQEHEITKEDKQNENKNNSSTNQDNKEKTEENIHHHKHHSHEQDHTHHQTPPKEDENSIQETNNTISPEKNDNSHKSTPKSSPKEEKQNNSNIDENETIKPNSSPKEHTPNTPEDKKENATMPTKQNSSPKDSKQKSPEKKENTPEKKQSPKEKAHQKSPNAKEEQKTNTSPKETKHNTSNNSGNDTKQSKSKSSPKETKLNNNNKGNENKTQKTNSSPKESDAKQPKHKTPPKTKDSNHKAPKTMLPNEEKTKEHHHSHKHSSNKAHTIQDETKDESPKSDKNQSPKQEEKSKENSKNSPHEKKIKTDTKSSPKSNQKAEGRQGRRDKHVLPMKKSPRNTPKESILFRSTVLQRNKSRDDIKVPRSSPRDTILRQLEQQHMKLSDNENLPIIPPQNNIKAPSLPLFDSDDSDSDQIMRTIQVDSFLQPKRTKAKEYFPNKKKPIEKDKSKENNKEKTTPKVKAPLLRKSKSAEIPITITTGILEHLETPAETPQESNEEDSKWTFPELEYEEKKDYFDTKQWDELEDQFSVDSNYMFLKNLPPYDTKPPKNTN